MLVSARKNVPAMSLHTTEWGKHKKEAREFGEQTQNDTAASTQNSMRIYNY